MYDFKTWAKMVGGGGCPDVAPKRNTPRPQNYTGKYVVDDPKRVTARKGDPAPKMPDSPGEPDINEIQNDTWGGGDYRGGYRGGR